MIKEKYNTIKIIYTYGSIISWRFLNWFKISWIKKVITLYVIHKTYLYNHFKLKKSNFSCHNLYYNTLEVYMLTDKIRKIYIFTRRMSKLNILKKSMGSINRNCNSYNKSSFYNMKCKTLWTFRYYCKTFNQTINK